MNTLVKNFAPIRKVNTFPTFFDTFFNELETAVPRGNVATFPAVNVIENENAYTIHLAAPGLSKEDFKVNVHENTLTISSEKQENRTEKTDKFTRKEFSYHSFKRSFALPETVETDSIVATYTDGVLKFTLPKKEEAKPKEPRLIEIA